MFFFKNKPVKINSLYNNKKLPSAVHWMDVSDASYYTHNGKEKE